MIHYLAYIKAVGIGLGFELQRAQFSMDNEFRRATILIDGKSQTEWKFGLDYIGDGTHSVAVAIGPPNEAIPSFRNFLPNGKKNKIEQETAEKRVSIPFKEVSIEEIIPK